MLYNYSQDLDLRARGMRTLQTLVAVREENRITL